MRVASVVLLLGAVACGDGSSGADAAPPVDAREPDYSCAGEEIPGVIPDPIELSGTVYEPGLTGAHLDRVVPRATVGAWNPSRTFLMLSRLTDDDGVYSLRLPTGGAPLEMLLEVKAPLYRKSIAFLPTDPFESRDDIVVALFTDQHVDSIMTFAGLDPDPAKGIVIAKAFDCQGVPVEGATLSIDPAPIDTLYVGDTGLPRYEEGTTSQGAAIFLDVPAGQVTLTAERDGMAFRSSTFEVEPLGQSITTAAIVP